jgi:hypothetical protein
MNTDKNIPVIKAKYDLFPILGIVILLLMVFIILVPTKTTIENFEISYTEPEIYNVTENQTVTEPYTYYDTKPGMSRISGTGRATFIIDCGDCYCDRQPIPMIFTVSGGDGTYCASCMCERSGYRTVTKNVEVWKTRNITKTRTESRPIEVNWIFGFKLPYALHFPFIS